MTKVPAILTAALALFLTLCGCQTVPVRTAPVLEDEGEVFLYLQPFPQEAERIRFSLAGIAAHREDGTQVPLALAMHEFSGADMTRQRLIASGRLPAGRYDGLLITVTSAALKNERGENALAVPETPQKRDFLFKLEKRQSSLITLTFKFTESVPNEFTFNPQFLISAPSRPLVEVLGYVANAGRNTLTIFNKMQLQAVGVIATGDAPRAVALDQRLKRVYVVLSGDDAVEVLDMKDQSVVTKIMLLRGDDPQAAALTPDGRTLLVADAGSNTLSVIDTLSLVETDRIAVGRGPRSVVIDRTGRKAYVVNSLSDNISVIDISYRQVIGSIATGPEPVRCHFNNEGNRLYVVHAVYPFLLVIDPSSFSVVKQVALRAGAVSLKVDARTGLIYVGRKNDVVVTLYDPFTFSPVDTIPTGGTAGYMVIDSETNNLYVLIPERRALMVVNLAGKRPVAEIDVSEDAAWVTVPGER
jgi:YVTN family beta-propeller protein